MNLQTLKQLKSYLGTYQADEVFFSPYFDGIAYDVRSIILIEQASVGELIKKIFQDLSTGKIVSDFFLDGKDKGHHYQDRNYYKDGYNLKKLLSIKEVALMLAMKQKENYRNKEIEIMLANFKQIIKTQEKPEIQKRLEVI